jgi:hypothetical protein
MSESKRQEGKEESKDSHSGAAKQLANAIARQTINKALGKESLYISSYVMDAPMGRQNRP